LEEEKAVEADSQMSGKARILVLLHVSSQYFQEVVVE